MSAPASVDTTEPAPPTRLQRGVGYALLAALAYIPVMLTATGRVVADTKQYLYLDPGRLLARAPYLWQNNTALGTVTHENIGYLFPAGPFYWVLETAGVPEWVAQRLWLGSILFGAGLGVFYLLRTLHVRGPGVVLAALAYMLSPYSLVYASRLSILLVAWAALPWMLALVARGLRDDSWKYPAVFAIVVQLAGSVNATALIMVGVAPLLWVPYSVWVSREVSLRQALRTTGRIAVLTLLASLWWIVGLSVQANYGLNELKFTETIKDVSDAGLSGEILRGLGYWFFYGGDKLGPWIEAVIDYTARRWLLVVSYGIPVTALVAAVFIRWKHRIYFIALILVGVTIAVGAHPYDSPSPFGAIVKAFGQGSTVGLALRSVGRAGPLVVLAMAVFLGLGANVLVRWLRGRGWPRLGHVACAIAVVVIIVNLPALWNGTFYGKNLQRPETLPKYWTTAIAALNAKSHSTRILELPGADFSSYRWGNTVEPITPGLTDRPYVARELVPYGSAPSANLLDALDRQLQLGILDPQTVAPIARLLGVGDVVLRNDLQVDRYDLARPKNTWLLFSPTPSGLKAPTSYGTSLGPPLAFSLLDAKTLALPANMPDPAPVVDFPVQSAVPIVRNDSGPAVVVAGDGDGLVNLAADGLLTGNELIQYSAAFANDPQGLSSAISGNSVLVVTDSNRKRAERWDNVNYDVGYTERPGEQPLVTDTSDNQLDPFPGAGENTQTVMAQNNVQVSATGYGSNSQYLPADRPAYAFDGDPTTAWTVGAFDAVDGQRLVATLDHPITTGSVNLVQPLTGFRNRFITSVTLQFADAHGNPVGQDVTVPLGPASRTSAGQTVTFPKRRFARFTVVIDTDNQGAQTSYGHSSGVGFAEVRLHDDATPSQDVHVSEVVRMPTDLTSAAAARSTSHPLVYEMTRLRTVLAPPNTTNEEPSLVRSFTVPSARDFGIVGTARLALGAPDNTMDAALGQPDASSGGVTVTASEHMTTTASARASSAIDGDPTTAWSTQVGDTVGQWLDVQTPQPVTFDHLNLQVVADGRHSVPTQVRIDAGGQSRTVTLPAVADQASQDAAVPAPISFPALTGNDIRVTITAVRPEQTIEYYSDLPTDLPVAIAELGIPGVQRPALPTDVPAACRTDLVTLDGRPLPVRLVGTTATAVAGGPLQVQACNPDGGAPAPLHLTAGTHLLRAVPGTTTGIDLDGLVLASGAGGGAATLTGPATTLAAPAPAPPALHLTSSGETTVHGTVSGAQGPFWLVLGQSFNSGWHAVVNGHDLGAPQLVDGMSNGWLVHPGHATTLSVTLKWTPQNRVWVALAISGLTMLLCALLALWPRRRVAVATVDDPDGPVELASPFIAAGLTPTRRAIVSTTAAVTLVAGLIVNPLVGILAGALTVGVLLRPRLRWTLTVGAPAALAVAGGYVFIQQWRHMYPSIFTWPTFFDSVHVIGWLAVILLSVDALVEFVRTRHRSDT
ncbi:MAG TPA: alpha-(1-_3)-arabinofuranosyltransferase family protein [Acidimicrobiia bacterium]